MDKKMRVLWAVLVVLLVVIGGWLVLGRKIAPGAPGPQKSGEGPKTITSERTEATVRTSIGGSAKAFGVTLRPTALVEDSRCPQDVQCIQAGTVLVKVDIISGLGTSSMTIGLGKSVTTESEEITLTSVEPEKVSTGSVTPEDYHFTFRIQKRP